MRGLGVRLLAIVATCGALLVSPSVAGATSDAGTPRKGGTLITMESSDNHASWDPVMLLGVPRYDSPGAFAIYDTLKFIKADVSTFCFGQAAWRPRRHRSPFTGSMITTGSVRGKCSARQAGQTRFQPPSAGCEGPPQAAQ